MCSTFEAPLAKNSRLFNPDHPEMVFEEQDSLSVFPDHTCPVLHQNGEVAQMQYGLSVSWSPRPVFNARIETLPQKPTFQNLMGNRCLVPCRAYYEWRTDGRAQKHKNRISDIHGSILWMAGLYQNDRCVVLTRPASAQVDHIHGRMPFFIPQDQLALWWQAPYPFQDLKPDEKIDLITEEDTKKSRQMDLF